MDVSTEQLESIQCPKCGNQIPVIRNFVTWCEKCDWNLSPLEKEPEKGLLVRAVKNFGVKQGFTLKEIAKHQAFPNSKISFSGFITIISSILIHLFTLGYLLLGLWIIKANWSHANIIPILFGIFLLFLAWFLRPRGEKAEKRQLTRKEFPHTFDFFEKIGNYFNIKVDLIGVYGEYNALVSSVGIFQKKQVVIGLPLISSLSDQEVVALFSHEFAHLKSTDITQNILVSTALETLQRLYSVIHPGNLFEGNTVAVILMLPFRIIGWLFSELVRLCYIGLSVLSFRSHQLSEYRSDIIATQYAGKQTVLNLFKKIKFQPCFTLAVKNAALTTDKDFDLYKEINNLINTVPQREITRLDKLEAKEEIRIDSTHPPLVFREEVISTLPDLPSKIMLIEFDFVKIRKELSTYNNQIQEYLADNYSRYYH